MYFSDMEQKSLKPVRFRMPGARVLSDVDALTQPFLNNMTSLNKEVIKFLIKNHLASKNSGSSFDARWVLLSQLQCKLGPLGHKKPAVWAAVEELSTQGWVKFSQDAPAQCCLLLGPVKASLIRGATPPPPPPASARILPAAPPLPATPAQPVLVLSAAAASEAVAFLRAQPEVALDCEGDLERHGSVCLIQAAAAGRTYLFDVFTLRHAASWDSAATAAPTSSAPPPTLHSLRSLLEDPNVVKVMHDCRADAEALFYLYDIRLAPVWDTQVAHGLQVALGALGSPQRKDTRRAGLNVMLASVCLPPNPHKSAVHARMDSELDLWTRRPMDAQLMAYAAADVAQLVLAKEAQALRLGRDGCVAALRLSRAAAVAKLDPADQGLAATPASYAAAASVPTGVDLELTFDAAANYRPRFKVAACADAGAVPGLALPRRPSPAEDPDLAVMLSLFPASVGSEVLQLCGEPAAQQAHSFSGVNGATSSEAGSANGTPAIASGLDGALGSGAYEHLLLPLSREDAPAGQFAVAPSPSPSPSIAAAVPAAPPALRMRYPTELIVDKGRPVSVRFKDGQEDLVTEMTVAQALTILAGAKGKLHLDDEGNNGGDLFHTDNRMGIPRTLHRISALRSRGRNILGLTYRIGRHLEGSSRLVLDVLAGLCRPAASAQGASALCGSLLLLGPPGVGKTTLLRDISRVLADDFRQSVIVVDSSNEIGGDGDEPHPCIGRRARRMQVPVKEEQYLVLTEAVQNHTPQVLIIDEIGTKNEVEAARKHAQAGVILVGTAHGVSLEGLLKNPELNGLVGGVTQTTVGDIAASATHDGRKTQTERRGAPAFSVLVEVLGYERYRLHTHVASSVDALLQGQVPHSQLRWAAPDGRIMARTEARQEAEKSRGGALDQLLRRGAQEGSEWLCQLAALAALLP